MVSDWPLETIAQCASSEPYSTQIGPFGKALMAHEYTQSGVPVLRGVNVNHGRFYDDAFVFISEGKANQLSKFESYPGDVLLVHKGTLGEIGLMPSKRRYPRYILGNSMMRVRCDPAKLLPEYLFYWLSSSEGQHYLFSRISQVGVPQLQTPLTTLREAVLPVPPIPEQQGIVRILSAMDEKIELEQQMNKNLEAIGRAIFKYWFVDFEFPNEEGRPYKSSGGEMVYNEEVGKEIPKAWKVRTLDEISVNFDSKRVPLSSRERGKIQGTYPYYGATGILDYVNNFIFDGTYVLMGEDGSVVDESGFPILQLVWGRFWVNNHAHVLQGNGISTQLLFLLLKNTNVQHIITGAVQPKINQHNMNTLRFVVPEEASRDRLQKSVNQLYVKMIVNTDQVKNLSQIRELLLPKLMSGKIRVPVPKENVEA
jgi:type I restriction enzyme S subunit